MLLDANDRLRCSYKGLPTDTTMSLSPSSHRPSSNVGTSGPLPVAQARSMSGLMFW